MKIRRNRGMVLSLAIVIIVILLVLGTSVATMGTGNLNIALNQLNNEKGFQAAEAGVAYACNDLALGNLNALSGGLVANRTYTLGQTTNQDQAYVEIFENPTGATPQPSGCPVQIPQGYIYLISTGRLKNGTKVTLESKVGAMVCQGGGGCLSYGVNCRDFSMDQGNLVAYDLKNATEVPSYTVAASNSTAPAAGKIQFGSKSPVQVKGNIILPAGAGTAIGPTEVVQGSCALVGGATVQNFASQLNFPKINLPVLPLQSATTASKVGGTLASGYYPTLHVEASQKLKGRYVIDSLAVDSGSVLSVETGEVVEIFINSLSYSDSSPLFHHEGSSNALKVNYTGSAPLSLTIDKDSHMCLLAPNATVTVNASDLALGAFAANRLDVHMATSTDRFCYDPTAGQPVVPVDTSAKKSAPAAPKSSNEFQEIIPGYNAVTVMGRQRF